VAPPDVEVVGVAARHRRPPEDLWRPPIPVRPLPLPRPALYEGWHALGWPAVQTATGAVDVVHATTLVVPPRSAPLVVTVHDLAFLTEPQHLTSRGLRFHRKGLALAKRRADLVLVPSRTTAAACEAAGIPAERLRVVPWGVDPERASPEDVAAARARYRLDGPYVVFVGTQEPRKNLPAVVHAVQAAGDGHDLVVVGPTGWGPQIGPLLDALGPRARSVGFVPDADRRALLAGAAALCFPSLQEGFGLPVLEAMAQGTPVVTSAGTATEEVAGGAAVLVDPRDRDAVAEGLARVLRDEAEAARLAAAGLARAAAMSWAETGRRTLAAYRELAGGGPAA